MFQYGFSHVSAKEFGSLMKRMRDDPVGKRLPAVRDDRLYRGGSSCRGLVFNLFQTTVAAKQFYPDRFGEWSGADWTLADEGNWLFDHRRLANVVAGTF